MDPRVVYGLLCLLVGFFGRDRKLGFWGYLFLSAWATPLVGLVIMQLGAPRPERRPRWIE
jgi:hypothetical protein